MQEKFDAGCLLSLGVQTRLATAALNYEIYCILDGSPSEAPSITELSDFATGQWGALRFGLHLASVGFSDLCCYLVLSHATAKESWSPLFRGLLVASCSLDVVQAMTTNFAYHYVAIQLAGCGMCLTLLLTLHFLWQKPEVNMARLRLATSLFVALFLDLAAVAVLHNQWAASSLSWTALEYLGLALYTSVLVAIGGLLPKGALVKFGWLPRIVDNKALLPQHLKAPKRTS
ncbi:unnamed protein product [Effrenium voratum]|uniref:Uncharacterized protein n=1 Tax=Effrenium voratum TaxID=2562239 RepID=A0AA36IJP8_9DINO|nr:unnamed protein product [Effrenium voratum]